MLELKDKYAFKTALALLIMFAALLLLFSGCRLPLAGKAYAPGDTKTDISSAVQYIKDNPSEFTIILDPSITQLDALLIAPYAGYFKSIQYPNETDANSQNLLIISIDSNNPLAENFRADACSRINCGKEASFVKAQLKNGGVNLILDAPDKGQAVFTVKILYSKYARTDLFGYDTAIIESTSQGTDINPYGFCADGTFYNSCSAKKPLFCNAPTSTILDKCSKCGCSEGAICRGEDCVGIRPTGAAAETIPKKEQPIAVTEIAPTLFEKINEFKWIIISALALILVIGIILGFFVFKKPAKNSKQQKEQKLQEPQEYAQLRSYIQRMRQSRYNDAQIRQALINSGWETRIIDSQLKTISPIMQQPSQQPQMHFNMQVQMPESEPAALQLLNYIRKERTKGINDEQIQKALINTGWDLALVQQEMQKK